LLRAYAASLVKDEWPVMLRDQRHDSTTQAFAALSRRILAIDPTNERQNLVLGEMFKTLDTMADVRAQRLNIVTIRLPPIYWWVVALAIGMLLFVSGSIQQTSFRRTILCAQAAVGGETAIQPDAIVSAMQRMDTRTQ